MDPGASKKEGVGGGWKIFAHAPTRWQLSIKCKQTSGHLRDIFGIWMFKDDV